MLKCCPSCGHPCPQDIVPGLHLTGIQEKILLIVSQKSPRGIGTHSLVREIYTDDPDGGPDNDRVTLRAHVYKLNQKLKKHGLRVTGLGNDALRYRLIAVP